MTEHPYICPNGCRGSYEIRTTKDKGIVDQNVKCLMCLSTMTPVVAIVGPVTSSSPVRDQQNY